MSHRAELAHRPGRGRNRVPGLWSWLRSSTLCRTWVHSPGWSQLAFALTAECGHQAQRAAFVTPAILLLHCPEMWAQHPNQRGPPQCSVSGRSQPWGSGRLRREGACRSPPAARPRDAQLGQPGCSSPASSRGRRARGAGAGGVRAPGSLAGRGWGPLGLQRLGGQGAGAQRPLVFRENRNSLQFALKLPEPAIVQLTELLNLSLPGTDREMPASAGHHMGRKNPNPRNTKVQPDSRGAGGTVLGGGMQPPPPSAGEDCSWVHGVRKERQGVDVDRGKNPKANRGRQKRGRGGSEVPAQEAAPSRGLWAAQSPRSAPAVREALAPHASRGSLRTLVLS